MKIPCSNCNQRLEIPEELAGQTIECPACKASLTVPTPEPASPSTPQVQVTPQQTARPQAPASKRKSKVPPEAASSKKSKLPIPKWAIAAVFGCLMVLTLIILLNGVGDNYTTTIQTPTGQTGSLKLRMNSDYPFVLTPKGRMFRSASQNDDCTGSWRVKSSEFILDGRTEQTDLHMLITIDKRNMRIKSFRINGIDIIKMLSAEPLFFE